MAKPRKSVTKETFVKAMDALPQEEIRRLVKDDSGIALPQAVSDKQELIELAFRASQENEKPEPKTDERKFVVRVVGQPQRFRAGRRWTQVSTVVSESELSPEGWAQLRADRVIEVFEAK